MPALDIPISREEARAFALEAYFPFRKPSRDPSHPLSKCLASKLPEVCSTAFWPTNLKSERVKSRHQCGFYVAICLTALSRPDAFTDLYFHAAFQHLGESKYSHPDKGVIKAGLRHAHIEFDNSSSQPVFHLTDQGSESYLQWLHRYPFHQFTNMHTRNIVNLIPEA